MATPRSTDRVQEQIDSARAQLRLNAQIDAAGGVEQAGVADDGLGGDGDVASGDGRVFISFGIVLVAVASAGEVVPDGKFARGNA